MKKYFIVVVISLLGFLTSCSGDDAAAPTTEQAAEQAAEQAGATEQSVVNSSSNASNKGFTVVDVYYGTDRKKANNGDINEYYGVGRANNISYGMTEVSIPDIHEMGEIESPSIWRLEFSSNPKKHIKLLGLLELEKKDYFIKLNMELNSSTEKSALIFVHGFNVTFKDAARRTAQMAYDLKFTGVPIFYSWPSIGKTASYTVDESNIKVSEKYIEIFLKSILVESSAENIYLIAHSMGNRGLTRSLANLLEKDPSLAKKVKEIILTAPDIDADVFKNNILPRLVKYRVPITLYASADDKALQASKKIHGHPRAGDAGESLVLANGMETIDATGVDMSFLKHSYFSEIDAVLSDIDGIINKQLRANDRFYLKKSANDNYWVFRK